MRLTESNLREQILTPTIIVRPEVQFMVRRFQEDFYRLDIDARSLIKRDVSLYNDLYYHSKRDGCYAPNFIKRYQDDNHLYGNFDKFGELSLYVEEFAKAEELIKLNKKHIVIFETCLMYFELTYNPKYDNYYISDIIEKCLT